MLKKNKRVLKNKKTHVETTKECNKKAKKQKTAIKRFKIPKDRKEF